MADSAYKIIDINEIDIESLLNKQEDETFDRTVGAYSESFSAESKNSIM